MKTIVTAWERDNSEKYPSLGRTVHKYGGDFKTVCIQNSILFLLFLALFIFIQYFIFDRLTKKPNLEEICVTSD